MPIATWLKLCEELIKLQKTSVLPLKLLGDSVKVALPTVLPGVLAGFAKLLEKREQILTLLKCVQQVQKTPEWTWMPKKCGGGQIQLLKKMSNRECAGAVLLINKLTARTLPEWYRGGPLIPATLKTAIEAFKTPTLQGKIDGISGFVATFFDLQTDATKEWWSRLDTVASVVGRAVTAAQIVFVLLEWRHIFLAERMLERAMARTATVEECRRGKDAMCEELRGQGEVRGRCIAAKWRECLAMAGGLQGEGGGVVGGKRAQTQLPVDAVT